MMPNIVPASAQGLPSLDPANDKLPLYFAYREWLDNEARVLGAELFEGFYGKDASRIIPQNTGVGDFHFPSGKRWWEMPPASGRASIIMAAAGVDLSSIRMSCADHAIWQSIRAGGSFAKREA